MAKRKATPPKPRTRRKLQKAPAARPLPPPDQSLLVGLNAKQQRFVEEYLVDCNGTKAAIRAGYSSRTAGSQAFDLLKKPEIHAAIANAREQLSAKLSIEVEDIAKELVKLGFSNIFDYSRVNETGDVFTDFTDVTRHQAAAISELTVEEYTEGRGRDARNVKRTKVKLADKRGALQTLSELLGYMKKKVEMSGGLKVEDGGIDPEQLRKLPTARLQELQALYNRAAEIQKEALA